MITLRFDDNKTLDVERSALEEIPFFKSMLAFEDSDLAKSSVCVNTLFVHDLSYELLYVLLDKDCINKLIKVSNYLGMDDISANLQYACSQNAVYRRKIITHNTYEEFVNCSIGEQVQQIVIRDDTYQFNKDMTMWCCDNNIRCDDLLFHIIHTAAIRFMMYYKGKFRIKESIGVERLRIKLDAILLKGDVKNLNSIIEDLKGADHTCHDYIEYTPVNIKRRHWCDLNNYTETYFTIIESLLND